MKIIITLMLIFIPINLVAEDKVPTSHKVTKENQIDEGTLEEVIALVFRHNPKILAKREQLRSIEMLEKQAYSGYLPRIDIYGGVGTEHRNYKSTFVPNSYTEDVAPHRIGIKANINLYEGGKTESNIKIAKNKKLAESYALKDEEQSICMQAIEVYLSYLNSIKILDLKKNNKFIMQAHYRECKDRVSLGRGTSTDIAQSEARLSRADSQLIFSEITYKNICERFYRIVGRMPKKLKSLDTSKIEKFMPYSLEEAENIAISNHPKLKQLMYLKKIAEESVVLAKSGLMPKVDVSVSAIHQKKDMMLNRLSKCQAELTVTVPVYEGGVSGYKAQEANHQVLMYINDLENTKREILEAVRYSWNEIQRNRSEIISVKLQVNANKKALDGVKDESINGSRTTLDVLNAEQELLDTKVDLSHAEHDLIKAYFALLRAIGRLS